MSARGVLVMAYGTPSSLDDMAAYLTDVREGRPPSPALVAEMTARYRHIGGSPLTRLTLQQAAALEAELRARGCPAMVRVGMRHWEPRIAAAVKDLATAGVDDAVAIVMAPHYSAMSGGRYRRRVEESCGSIEAAPSFRFVEAWWMQPGLTAAWTELLRAAFERAGARDEAGTRVVFTAHSLPARIRETGDTYEAQLREHARLIAGAVGLSRWDFAFQSAGASPEPWLGPSIGEKLAALAADRVERVIVAPIGFVCDHVEILHDLDVDAVARAAGLGLRFSRTGLPNLMPGFIGAIADAVLAQWDTRGDAP